MTDTVTDRLVEIELLIDGESASAANGATYDSTDPIAGQPRPPIECSTAASRSRARWACRPSCRWSGGSATLG